MDAFDEILKRAKPENEIFVSLNLDISEQVRFLLALHPEIKTQQKLSEKLNKQPSEISKWLSGLHNLTLESIAKMQAVLGSEIIMTDKRAREKYGSMSEGVSQKLTVSKKTQTFNYQLPEDGDYTLVA